MQQNDDGRRANRPSLLSEQPPAADNQSILNKLDGGKGRVKPARAKRQSHRLPVIAAALVVGAGALAWALQSDGPLSEPTLVAAAVTPAAVPAPSSVPAPVSVPIGANAGQAAPESDVSAAAILQEPGASTATGALVVTDPKPAASVQPTPSAQPTASTQPGAPEARDELTLLLDKPAAPPAAVAVAALQKTAAPSDSAEKVIKKSEPVPPARTEKDKPRSGAAEKDQAKVAEKEKERARDKEHAKAKDSAKSGGKDSAKDRDTEKDKKTAVAAAPKKKPAAKAQPKVDSDVALLAALLAHAKAHPVPRVSKTATEYKRCGTLASVAEADKCRERLCEGSPKKKAECKTLRVTKVSG